MESDKNEGSMSCLWSVVRCRCIGGMKPHEDDRKMVVVCCDCVGELRLHKHNRDLVKQDCRLKYFSAEQHKGPGYQSSCSYM